MADLSVLIAHKREPANDEALEIALSMLQDNSSIEYELLIDDETPKDPFRAYNDLAARATSDWILFMNSDTFPGPNWDKPMIEVARHHLIITPVLVEPGAIGVNVVNLERHFGDTPANFDRKSFETWVKWHGEMREGEGWYMPSLHPRKEFLELGGYPTHLGRYPDITLDIKYWETWKAAGYQIKRAWSWFYHLQSWSAEHEQVKRGYYDAIKT